VAAVTWRWNDYDALVRDMLAVPGTATPPEP
jgi:hypothetical protein